MLLRLVLLLVIVDLTTIIIKTNASTMTIIDNYLENITEWNDLYVYVSCVQNETLDLPETICYHTTVSSTQSTTVTILSSTQSTTVITVSSTQSTTVTTKPKVSLYECPDKNYIGPYCNITVDLCSFYHPCIVNQGICHPNKTLQSKYSCECLSDEYSGYDCENDNRICKNNTCWHNGQCIHGSVAIDNKTTFECICKPGYNGTHCELVDDMCVNITCENKGRCISSYLSWSCRCLDSGLYSGTYCEHKSTSLVVRQVLSKSFASIAIAAIIAVYLFVIMMDILKYVFGIDPVDRERRLMKLKQGKKRSNKKMNEKLEKVTFRDL